MKGMERMIRERAYQLWESAGRPEGRSEEFWLAAKAEFERREPTRERRLGASEATREHRLRLPVRRSADVRGETAADWRVRRRDPSFWTLSAFESYGRARRPEGGARRTPLATAASCA